MKSFEYCNYDIVSERHLPKSADAQIRAARNRAVTELLVYEHSGVRILQKQKSR